MSVLGSRRPTTAADLARVVGVSDSYISMLLAGKRGTSTKTATKIAKALGLTVDQVLARIEALRKKRRRA